MTKTLMVSLLLLCSACIQLGSDPLPMRHYLLQPNAEAKPVPLKSAVEITLGQLQFPAYLDRLQVTTHDDQHQVHIASLDRWSEPLEESFTRVLTENLARHLQDGREESPGQQGHEKEHFLVKLLINSFDGILGQQTSVDIRWSIVRVGMKELVQQGHFVEKMPIGNNYVELVQGLNNALNNFSQTLALRVAESH